MIISDSNCLSHAAARSVAVDCVAHPLSDDKPTAHPAPPADGCIEREQRAAPGFPIAPHSLELIRLPKSVGAFHDNKN
jgi:hypothetical protein